MTRLGCFIKFAVYIAVFVKEEVMTTIQEVVIRTDKGALFTLHIIKASSLSSFTAEVLAFEPTSNPQYSSLICVAGSFSKAELAFEAGFKWVVEFCQARQQVVTHIKNPCNFEFLSSQSQQHLVQQQGVNVTVTGNA